MTRLGHFLNVLVTKFLSKVAHMFGNFTLSTFKTHIILDKNCCGNSWTTFGKIGQLFHNIWSHWKRSNTQLVAIRLIMGKKLMIDVTHRRVGNCESF